MNKKTYQKMTRKSPIRWLKLFKQTYLTKQRFFAFLAKIRLIKEVKDFSVCPYISNDSANKVRLLNDKIITDRGVFNLSYFATCNSCNQKWWYESYFKKSRLYTVEDRIEYSVNILVHADCESFLVKVDPFTSGVVTLNTPTLVTRGGKHICCDFIGSRLGTSVTLYVDSKKDIDWAVQELLSRAKIQLQEYIEGNYEEINEKMTGIKYDGDFFTEDGKRLMPNCICNRCGMPVFQSSTEGYTAQCVVCDEDLYDMEILRVDPVKYEDICKYTKERLYQVLFPEDDSPWRLP